MAAKKKVLGRGLDLLIPEGNNTKQSKTEKESKPIIKEVVKEVVKEVKVPAETFLKFCAEINAASSVTISTING